MSGNNYVKYCKHIQSYVQPTVVLIIMPHNLHVTKFDRPKIWVIKQSVNLRVCLLFLSFVTVKAKLTIALLFFFH